MDREKEMNPFFDAGIAEDCATASCPKCGGESWLDYGDELLETPSELSGWACIVCGHCWRE